MGGLFEYGIYFITIVGIYGLMSIALNLQWGMTGLFNIGIAAFFAVGAYASAIVTTEPTSQHLGGFGMPFVVGLLAAVVLSGAVAWLVGLVTLNLRADYLAIATIGIAEIIRLALRNEGWLTAGVRGIAGIPRPFDSLPGVWSNLAYLAIVAVALGVVYWGFERLRRAPWGRVLRAIRENEDTAQAAGKNVVRFRMEAFIIGSAVMGLAGALYTHYITFISPEAFEPMFVTFLVWVMLIAGGSGNNKGALLGALVIWMIWAGTDMLTASLTGELATRAGALRLLLIGVLLQVILLWRPEGLLSEAWDRQNDLKRQRRADPEN